MAGLGVKEAVAPCICASVTVFLTRYVDVRTTDMIFDSVVHMASSPLELGLLAMLVLWLASWVLDRHARAAQVLSSLQLRVLGAAFMHTAGLTRIGLSRAAAVAAVTEAPGSSPAVAAEPASPRPSSGSARRLALAPSPGGKDISSFRLPDHAIAGSKARRRAAAAAAAGKQQPGGQAWKTQQRWSLDVAGGHPRRQQVGTQPKPRTSVDFDPSPGSPPRRPRRGASLADHRAAPQLQAGAAGGSGGGVEGGQLAQPAAHEQGRWQPRMQRIASGQELAELAAASGAGSACSSLDAGSARASMDSSAAAEPAGPAPVPAQTGAEQAPPKTSGSAAIAASNDAADASSASVAPTAAAAAHSSWLPSLSLAWPASPGAAEAGAAAAAAVDPSDPGASPFSPTSAAAAAAAAAVARRVAASGTAAAAWASSTMDSVLRPLIPAGSGAGSALLWRSSSPHSRSGDAVDSSGGGAAAANSSAAAAGAQLPLEHAASAPLPRDVVAAGSAVDGLAEQAFASACLAACAAADRPGRLSVDDEQRRMSLDGVSARHYSHGTVTADPSRRAALENLASTARMQAAIDAPAALDGVPAHAPGRAAPAAAATAVGCLAPDAGTSCLASVGLDGDCCQEIRSHVTDEHLLQFAAVAGEAAAAAAAAELGLPAAWAGDGSLLGGAADGGAAPCTDDGWEQVPAGCLLVGPSCDGLPSSCLRGGGKQPQGPALHSLSLHIAGCPNAPVLTLAAGASEGLHP
ncbi:hypothetical protein ABPG75_002611 [Micractinium tetrahymenae]